MTLAAESWSKDIVNNYQSPTPFGGTLTIAVRRLLSLLWVAVFVGGLTLTIAVAQADSESPNIRLVVFGDSLVAGYGLKPSDAFPAQLQKSLQSGQYKNVKVVNAGVSGDTTAGGLQRFDWVVTKDTDAVILELGANDTLRGIDPKVTRRNLDRILKKLQERNIPVLLAGMRAARNWSTKHIESFERIYVDLAQKYGAILYPFFLEGVALNPKLNLDDGLHPNAKGVAQIVGKILPDVKKLLDDVRTRAAKSN